MKIAIIGAGQIARVHGPAILKQPNVQIIGIADRDLSRARSLAHELKVEKVYDDAALMIDQEKPEIVHILVPPQFHADVSIMAMKKGCHVLVEKPMALTYADAERMANAAQENNVKICVNHNMIYEEVVQKAIKIYKSGDIGEIVSVEACHVQNARRDQAVLEEGAPSFYWSYRLNGGPLQDWMPHMASLIFEFVPEIKEVQASGLNRGVLPQGWQDEIRVQVRSQVMFGLISISLSERPDAITLTLRGTKGKIYANLFNQVLTVEKLSGLPRAAVRGLSGFQSSWQYFKGSVVNVLKFLAGRVDKSSGIIHVVREFYQAIQEGKPSPIDVNKSLRVVDLISRVWPKPMVNIESLKRPVQTSERRPATALVTGASGFIGNYLIEKLLSENISVRAFLRPNSVHQGRLRKYDIEIVEGDLSDSEAVDRAVQGMQVIYHAGAAMTNDWYDHEQITIQGTENIIRSALKYGVKRVVHLSTLAVYELNEFSEGYVVREDSPYQFSPKKMGPYAYAKIEAEKKIMEAHQKNGLAAAIVRPGIVIGPKGKVFFPHLGFKNQDTLFLMVKGGKNRLPLTYVENTVDAIYKASVEDRAVGQIYNLVDDGTVTVKDYLECFRNVTGIPAKILKVPFFMFYSLFGMLEIASGIGILKKSVGSRAQFKWKHKSVVFDNSKAKADLDWSFKVPISVGMTKTFEWYNQHCR